MTWLYDYLVVILDTDGKPNRMGFLWGEGELLVTAGHNFSEVCRPNDVAHLRKSRADSTPCLGDEVIEATILHCSDNKPELGFDLAILRLKTGQPICPPSKPLRELADSEPPLVCAGYSPSLSRWETIKAISVGESHVQEDNEVVRVLAIDLTPEIAGFSTLGFSGAPWVSQKPEYQGMMAGMTIERATGSGRSYALPFSTIREHLVILRDKLNLEVSDFQLTSSEDVISRIAPILFPDAQLDSLTPERSFNIVRRTQTSEWHVETMPFLQNSYGNEIYTRIPVRELRSHIFRLRSEHISPSNVSAVLNFDEAKSVLTVSRNEIGKTIRIKLVNC